MKTFCFVIAIFLFSYISHVFAGDHSSVHGMLVVGKNKIYLSHLPMFHSPHDYQVIMEAELDGASLAAYKSLQGLVTLVPEPFVLPDMIANPRPFKAQIFAGHFERGGTLAANATVTIKKIILMRKLNPLEAKPMTQEGFLFGEANDLYLAHLVHGRPDFDQVLSVARAEVSGLVTFPGMDPRISFTKGEIMSSAGKLSLMESLYMETGDLSH